MGATITKLEDNVFRFEYEDANAAKKLKTLTRFGHEGVEYKIKRYHIGIEMPMYYSYIVITE